MKAEIRPTPNDQKPDPVVENGTPAATWRDIFLAALPVILVSLVAGLPMLLVELGLLSWESAGLRFLNIGLAVLLVACLLAISILAWRRRWPLWSALWYPVFVPLVLLLAGLSVLQAVFDFTIDQEMVMYVWLPLFIAVLLYAVSRLHPLRGLLAALPVIYLLWIPNMEFVANSIEIAITVTAILLVCLAVAFVLRRDDWRSGLYAILAMNLAVGALYAYAGIYHGGTLPFTAPGPNFVEVVRSLIPQYLATSAILLGPLFAWRFRQAGLAGGRSGKIAYHLALAGLLLVIMANLGSLMLTMQADSPGSSASDPMLPFLILGLGAYLVGVIWLYRYEPFPKTAAGWAESILLPFLPLGIPIMFIMPFITWKWPVSDLYGIPLLWVLPHAVSLSLGLVWLGLSVWVVTRGGETSIASKVEQIQMSTTSEAGVG
jgi:hypothetical protein